VTREIYCVVVVVFLVLQLPAPQQSLPAPSLMFTLDLQLACTVAARNETQTLSALRSPSIAKYTY